MKTPLLLLLVALTSCAVLRQVDANSLKDWKGRKKDELLRHPAWSQPEEDSDKLVRYVKNNNAWWVWDAKTKRADIHRDCRISFLIKKGVIQAVQVKEKCKTYEDVKP